MLLWGDLHNHCGITYGFGSLQNALKIARSHLDFCCITGHAMWPDIYARTPETEFIVDFHREGFKKLLDHWDEIRAEMARQNDGELVTFQSYEMHSSLYGDHHIISPDDTFPLIYRDSPARLVADCGVRAIAVPHHIGYTPGYRGINWELYDQNISPCVEVCSKHGCAMSETAPYPYYHDMGPRDSRNTVYAGLRRGSRFCFLGSTDHHAGVPGSYADGGFGEGEKPGGHLGGAAFGPCLRGDGRPDRMRFYRQRPGPGRDGARRKEKAALRRKGRILGRQAGDL